MTQIADTDVLKKLKRKNAVIAWSINPLSLDFAG
jgi:hypothetical protein